MTCWLDSMRRFLKFKHEIGEDTKIISDIELGEKIRAIDPNIKWFALDSKYWIPIREKFDEILKRDLLNYKKYESEKFDCDDFALAIAAHFRELYNLNCVGIVLSYSGGHAFNLVGIYENEDVNLYILEPQTDELMRPPSPNPMYKIETVIW